MWGREGGRAQCRDRAVANGRTRHGVQRQTASKPAEDTVEEISEIYRVNEKCNAVSDRLVPLNWN